MEAQDFNDAYRPMGGRFYAQRWNGPILYTQMPKRDSWRIYGIDKRGHYAVGHGLSLFYAKLYVDHLNRIANLGSKLDD